MNLFWQEYLFYIVAIFGVLVGISTSSLFFTVSEYEKRSRTIWRSVGFFLLVLAFFVFVLERKFFVLGNIALILQLLAYYCIYKGVLAQPGLSHLRDIKSISKPTLKFRKDGATSLSIDSLKNSLKENRNLLIFSFVILIVLVIVGIFAKDYLSVSLVAATMIFIGTTIFEQIKRYRRGKELSPMDRRHNLYPLVGYIFLFLSMIFAIFYRLPELDLVFLRKFNLDYSIIWQMLVYGTMLGFLFLAIWAWAFIKIRPFLRIYVVLLFIAVVVSSLGSLVFTTLIFRIIENNNLELMQRGTETVQVVLTERGNNALLVARVIAKDPEMQKDLSGNNYAKVYSLAEQYMKSSGVDIVRVFNGSNQVFVSPSDKRDEGRIFYDDSLLSNSITEKRDLVTLDTVPGVLADTVVIRALYPVMKNDVLIGTIEVGYKLDNPFVDFISKKTGLDATVFASDIRSATTLTTEDGISRWTGSRVSDVSVVKNVLVEGRQYSNIVNRLGQIFYSAYEPIRNINGKIIGMISVGTPTNILFENTRQQLINTFLIVTLISLVVAFLGYILLRSFRVAGAALLLLFSNINNKKIK